MSRRARNTAWLLAILALAALIAVWIAVDRDEPTARVPAAADSVTKVAESAVEPLALPNSESGARETAAESAAVSPPKPSAPEVPAATEQPATAAAPSSARVDEGAGRIYGRVIRPDGSPASARKVQMIRLPGGPKRNVVADEVGHFDERDLPTGKWYISTVPTEDELKALGYSKDTLYLEFASLRVVELIPDAEVEIELGGIPKDAIRVTGRIRAEPLPKMVALHWLPTGEAAYSRSQWKRSSADGTYELFLEEPGQYDVALTYSGNPSIVLTVDVPNVREFTHDFELGSSGVKGRLRAPTGEPVVKAWVELTLRAGHPPLNVITSASHKVRTDSDGRFAFELLAPARYVLATHDGRSKPAGDASALVVRDVTVAEGSGAVELDLVASAGRVVHGRVVREKGPTPSANVFVFDDHGDPINSFMTSTCNSLGIFALPALAPGRYTLIGAKYREWTDPYVVDIRSSEPAGEIELRLRDAAVLEVEGRDLGDAWIDVRDESGNCLSAVRDPNSPLMTEVATGARDPSRWTYFVPAGKYEIRAVGGAGVVARGSVSATPGETRHVTLAHH